jgi:hypothetical protein
MRAGRRRRMINAWSPSRPFSPLSERHAGDGPFSSPTHVQPKEHDMILLIKAIRRALKRRHAAQQLASPDAHPATHRR